MAGPDPTGVFVGSEFEAEIRALIGVAQSNDPAERPTFHFPAGRVFAPADDAGRPFDWHIDPDSTVPEKPDAQVKVIVEPAGGTLRVFEQGIGEAAPENLNLYFFRAEWDLVFDFVYVDVDHVPYKRIKRLPTIALYDVDLIQILVRAEDA